MNICARKKTVLVVILISSCVWHAAGQFVVKKKRKGPSCSTLKEQCCQEMGDILRGFPDLFRTCADIQSLDMQYIDQFLQGEMNTFCPGANKEQLQKTLEQLRSFNNYICDVRKKMKQHVSFLQSLKKDNVVQSKSN